MSHPDQPTPPVGYPAMPNQPGPHYPCPTQPVPFYLSSAPIKPGRGPAIASLVLGIVGAAMGIVPLLCWMALVLGILGLIFGIVGRRHGMGKAGIIMSLISITLGIVGAVIVASAVHDLDNSLTSDSLGDTSTSQADDSSFTDESFVTNVRVGTSYAGSDTQLIQLGHLACSDLDLDPSIVSAGTDIMSTTGMGAYDSGWLVGSAISAYCPQYTSLVSN